MSLLNVRGLSLFLILLIVFSLSACGGSSSGTSETATLSGYVADGYLSGAIVYLDCNDNRALDSDEISTTTDTNGQYVLDLSGAADVDDCSVVADVNEATIDLDTNMPVRNGYTLLSPPGYTAFVSPLTTMIQINYESNPGITVDEAHDTVKDLLSVDEGSTVNLFEDYIENSVAGADDADEYETLHRFAQLSARILGDNLDRLQQAAQDQNYTIADDVKDDLLRLTVKKIMQNADLITEAITNGDASDGGGTFNPDADAQAVDILVDTTDIDHAVQQEQAVFSNQVPEVKWGCVFRANLPDGQSTMDVLHLALRNDIDTTDYVFSVDGPGSYSYTFVADDLQSDPTAPVAMNTYLVSPDQLPEGEYIFYITPPGGTRTEVSRDTLIHKDISIINIANVCVTVDSNGQGRVYHDTLNGTYYYRVVIREVASGDFVYRSKRINRCVQNFPAQYATADYQYRVEAWDAPIFSDTFARSQTGWQNFETVVDIGAGAAEPSYYGAYWRQRYEADGTILQQNRKALDIAIANHDDLTGLTISSTAGFSYTLPVSAGIGIYENNSTVYCEKRSKTNAAGEPLIDYFLLIKNPTSGVETFTWSATTQSGGDFSIPATIHPQNALPCVDPSSVTISENADGLLTVNWDAVTSGNAGQDIFYRLRFLNDDAQYKSKRMPKTTLYIPRGDIEDAIGADLTDTNVAYRLEVIDANYYHAIHNWTDFGYQSVPIID